MAFLYENIKTINKIRRGGSRLHTKVLILKCSTKSMAPGTSPYTKRPHTSSYYFLKNMENSIKIFNGGGKLFDANQWKFSKSLKGGYAFLCENMENSIKSLREG